MYGCSQMSPITLTCRRYFPAFIVKLLAYFLGFYPYHICYLRTRYQPYTQRWKLQVFVTLHPVSGSSAKE
jgi:hypothetical protein